MELIKLVVFIVLQITALRPGALEGLTSPANSDCSKIPWKKSFDEWCILSHLPHVWLLSILFITKSPIWGKKELVKSSLYFTPTRVEKSWI